MEIQIYINFQLNKSKIFQGTKMTLSSLETLRAVVQSIWINKAEYMDAEREYHQKVSSNHIFVKNPNNQSSFAIQMQKQIGNQTSKPEPTKFQSSTNKRPSVQDNQIDLNNTVGAACVDLEALKVLANQSQYRDAERLMEVQNAFFSLIWENCRDAKPVLICFDRLKNKRRIKHRLRWNMILHPTKERNVVLVNTHASHAIEYGHPDTHGEIWVNNATVACGWFIRTNRLVFELEKVGTIPISFCFAFLSVSWNEEVVTMLISYIHTIRRNVKSVEISKAIAAIMYEMTQSVASADVFNVRVNGFGCRCFNHHSSDLSSRSELFLVLFIDKFTKSCNHSLNVELYF